MLPKMQGRAPDEGPSHSEIPTSEIGGTAVIEESNAEGCHDPKLLRAVVVKYKIDSTKSLVAAYNITNDEDERAVLRGWICKYGSRSEECLTPKSVLEYSELANIAPRSQHDKGILKSVVDTLCSCLCQREFLKPDFAVALYRTLVLVDSPAYSSVADLMLLATNLLDSLSPKPKLERGNFARYEATFLALNRTFLLLNNINRKSIYEKEKQDLRRSIAAKEKELELSCKYYPVNFHFKAFQQAIERLELKDVPSHPAQALRCVACGLCAFFHVFHCVGNLARGDVDPVAVRDAYRQGRDFVVDMGVPKRDWFDSFQSLMEARIEASKDETKPELFESRYVIAMENQRKMKKGEDLKALRFGIIQELGILAKEGPSENTRKEATMKLVDLATHRFVDEGWIDDVDVLIALLDILHELHKIGQCGEDTTRALKVLHQSCESFAKEALTEWLGGNSMEDKLRARSPQRGVVEHKDLCIKIGRHVGYIPIATMDAKREELRRRYLRDNFATVTSLFEEGSPKHVKDMKHHVVISEEVIEEREFKSKDGTDETTQKMEERETRSSRRRRDQAKEYYEKRTRVTKPIALSDLFKRRSLKPGDPESEVRSVLLYGNPGSGKTCITRVVAHKWALGEMAQDLGAVYVVPVRVLNGVESRGQKVTRLEEAISQICFRGSQHAFEYEDLLSQVEHDLVDPSTLLMLDGMDEANDYARELVSTVWKRSCKVLLLSRPYNMRNLETRVDVQVECLGFNDEQLRDYIRSELSEDEAPRLISSLENATAMWEMAHVPVTAHILCSLSKEHGGAIEEEGNRANTFRMYNDMANYVWKRFEEKQTSRNVQKVELFEDLEKIAFEALRKGLILIHERFVMEHATSKNAARTFKESGLLLLVLEGQEYQFPHLTFQEYFAGRYIARALKQKGSDEETRVLDFVRGGKYDGKHALTLTFAMHAFARGRNKRALEELLSTMDEQPVEVLGIRHFFLKMRVLEVILEETDEDDLEDLLNDEQAIELAEGARRLIERTVDDVLIREIVIEELRHLPCVLEGFPQVLNDTIDEVKKMLACKHDLTWKEMAKITDVLKLARHAPKHGCGMAQYILQLAETPDGWCKPQESIRRLSSIAEQLPNYAGEFLPTLAKGCGDGDSSVRNAAMEAVGSVVAAAPQHAGELLPTLAKGCSDEHWSVRLAAMEAVGRVGAAAPQHAGEIFSTLAKECGDEHYDVRQAAMEAVGSVVAAAPQHAGEFLSTLAKGCGDRDSSVRLAAMEAVGRVGAAAPQHAGEIFLTLAKGCGDESWAVRQAAMEAVGSVVAAAPQHAGEFLSTLAKGCGDRDSSVRLAAMEPVGSVVAAAPQHAGEIFSTLAKGCGDESWAVREAAIKAVGSVVAAAPQHADEIFSTLAKGCGDESWAVREAAMEAIGSVGAAAPQHAGEFLPMLAKGWGDESWDVREAAMKAVGRVGAAAPQHAGEFLSTLAKVCSDSDWFMRRAAMKAVGRVVAAAPQHAGEFLSTLAKGCGDRDSSVRVAAMEAVGRVVAAAPQHAGEFLPMLAKGWGDESWVVRETAMEAVGRVVAAAPQHAGEIFSTLAKGCGDESWAVRETAMEPVGRVVAAAPQHAGQILPTLAKGFGDEQYNVRQTAMAVVGSVVAAAPQHAGQILPTLAKGCGDENYIVREAAMAAVGNVVAAAPQHAGEFLPTLAKGCGDEASDVRNSARKAVNGIKPEEIVVSAMSVLPAYKAGYSFFFVEHSFTFDITAKRKTIPFVMHTTFSREIGKWTKDDIDVFVGFVRREFQEMFPGLIEHLETNE